MPTARLILAASVVGLVLVACTGGPDNSAGASAVSSSDSCEQLRTSAFNEMQAAIDANSTCTVDADCVTVERVANCFDACESPSNRAGPAAVIAARDRVNAAQCNSYQAQGCPPPIRPPCFGPEPLACVRGRCLPKGLQ